MGKKSRTKWEGRDRGVRVQVNKRQRKKAKAKVEPLRWMVPCHPPTVSNCYNPEYSNVQDHNSHSIMEQYLGAISPSRRLSDQSYSRHGVSFARISSGDQSRRDRFPSPYLPDGSENMEYAKTIGCYDHVFYGDLSVTSLMEEMQGR